MKILDKSLEIAYQLYPSNPTQKYYVFSFLYQRNTLISLGINDETKVCPKVKRLAQRFNVEKFKTHSFPHAEINCISKLWGKHYISGREKMVIIRIRRDGSLGLARPCINCHTILSALNLTNVYYSTYNQDFEEM